MGAAVVRRRQGYSPIPSFQPQGAPSGAAAGGLGTLAPQSTSGALPGLTAAGAGLGSIPGMMGGGGFGGDQAGAWGGFRNGLIPLSAMRNVYGFYVAPQVADNLMALLGAAQKAGVWNPSERFATGTYRPLSVQEQLWQEHQQGHHPAPVARPGTSLHGWGEAIDFNMANQALIRWLAGNAGRYGLYDRVGGEPWHYSLSGH